MEKTNLYILIAGNAFMKELSNESYYFQTIEDVPKEILESEELKNILSKEVLIRNYDLNRMVKFGDSELEHLVNRVLNVMRLKIQHLHIRNTCLAVRDTVLSELSPKDQKAFLTYYDEESPRNFLKKDADEYIKQFKTVFHASVQYGPQVKEMAIKCNIDILSQLAEAFDIKDPNEVVIEGKPEDGKLLLRKVMAPCHVKYEFFFDDENISFTKDRLEKEIKTMGELEERILSHLYPFQVEELDINDVEVALYLKGDVNERRIKYEPKEKCLAALVNGFSYNVGFLKKNPNHDQIVKEMKVSSMKEFQELNNETISCLNCQVFAGTGDDEDNPFEKGSELYECFEKFLNEKRQEFKLKMGKMYKSLGFCKEDFKTIDVTNTLKGLSYGQLKRSFDKLGIVDYGVEDASESFYHMAIYSCLTDNIFFRPNDSFVPIEKNTYQKSEIFYRLEHVEGVTKVTRGKTKFLDAAYGVKRKGQDCYISVVDIEDKINVNDNLKSKVMLAKYIERSADFVKLCRVGGLKLHVLKKILSNDDVYSFAVQFFKDKFVIHKLGFFNGYPTMVTVSSLDLSANVEDRLMALSAVVTLKSEADLLVKSLQDYFEKSKSLRNKSS